MIHVVSLIIMAGFYDGMRIPLPRLFIDIKSARVDCGALFQTVRPPSADGAPPYRLCHDDAGVLDLSVLNDLRTQDEELFLPTKIFVRECMHDTFNELFRTPKRRFNIVFGSPGVGKSVLSFLAALCMASIRPERPVLFMRKTKWSSGSISVFWIQKSSVDGQVDVYFDRGVDEGNTLNDVAIAMKTVGFLNDMNKVRESMPHIRAISDGPRHDDKLDQGGPGADLVTSGGYPPPKDEQIGSFHSLPVTAWTLEEMIPALRALYQIKARDTKAIFDVAGGNIRAAVAIAAADDRDEALEERRLDVDDVVNNGVESAQLKVAFESTAMSGSTKSIDRLRAMVATKVKILNGKPRYRTVQFIGSPYLLRAIRSMVSLKETRKGLVYARQSEIQSLYGWHFELFGHKIFRVWSEEQVKMRNEENFRGLAAVRKFEIVEGTGTGKLSVKDLKKSGAYWMPSTANFANIDAAIVVDGVLYGIQYTVSKSHTFNYRTFVSGFWDQLPDDFRKQIRSIRVVFVVPSGVTFGKVIVPSSQRAFCEALLSAQSGVEVVYGKASVSDDEQGGNEEADDDQGDEEDDAIMDVDEGAGEPKIHFQWESLSEDFDVEKPPLSFLAGADK